jgi:hypothetical protein
MSDTKCKCGEIHPGALYTSRGVIYESLSDEDRLKHFDAMKRNGGRVSNKKKMDKVRLHPYLMAIYEAAKEVTLSDPRVWSELERVIHDFECFKAKEEQS